jgi:hypothetical protein
LSSYFAKKGGEEDEEEALRDWSCVELSPLGHPTPKRGFLKKTII